jgi:hypothetical protein
MTCNLGDLPPSAQATIELLVDVTATGDTIVSDTASISTISADLNPANNAATLQERWGAPQ